MECQALEQPNLEFNEEILSKEPNPNQEIEAQQIVVNLELPPDFYCANVFERMVEKIEISNDFAVTKVNILPNIQFLIS